jgi:hypothetical protein
MAGDVVGGEARLPLLEWEGLWYRPDPPRAEHARLEGVRARQGGASLDEALRLCRGLETGGERKGHPCDAAVADALRSLVYAAHLGDPGGSALTGEDPSRRHDFGPDPWSLPEEVLGPGIAWHVRGSLLGLEVALAPLALRRLAGDELPDRPPALDPEHRRTLAVPAALMNDADLLATGTEAVASAVDRGRRRVDALRRGDETFDAVAESAGLEPWRAQSLAWLLRHDAGGCDTFFSLGELAHLGGVDRRRADAWGVADPRVAGLLPRLPAPAPGDETQGRPPQAALAAGFTDLPLRVAVHLAERGLPASLAPAMVRTLLPDLLAEARPVAADDRLALDAWVRQQSRERLDDVVASLAGGGPLQPAPAPQEAR